MIDRKFKILAINPVNKKHYTEEDSFLMCAKDAAVPAALKAYIEKCNEIGVKPEHIASASLLLERVLKYQDDVERRIPDTVGEEIVNCLSGAKPQHLCDTCLKSANGCDADGFEIDADTGDIVNCAEYILQRR